MKNNLKKDFSSDRFFEILKEQLLNIKKINYQLKDTYNLYNTCCSYDKATNTYVCSIPKISNLLKNKKGKKDFKNLLIQVFGPSFFSYSKEEVVEMKKKGIATYANLEQVFNGATGFINGKLIKIPTNYDEFTDVIEDLIFLSDNNHLNAYKNGANTLLVLKTIIEKRYQDFKNAYDNEAFCIKHITNILNLYKNEKEIKINDDVVFLSKILNENVSYEIMFDDELITNKDLGFGEVLIEMINNYNNELSQKNKEKELNKRINAYYKDLVNTPIEIMTNDQFPKYSDEDVVPLFKGIIKKMSDACDKDDSLFSILAITTMRYGHYYGTEYYEKKKQKTKNL